MNQNNFVISMLAVADLTVFSFLCCKKESEKFFLFFNIFHLRLALLNKIWSVSNVASAKNVKRDSR